jgi:hypothetical protein
VRCGHAAPAAEFKLAPQLRAEDRKPVLKRSVTTMLWTVFVVLLVLWLLGLVTSYTFGGFVHILLVLAVVVLIVRVIQGRRVL